MSKRDARGAVCVSGAAGGIGLALVERLLADGYAVAAWDLAPGALPVGERLTFDSVDVRSAAELQQAARAAQERFGSIHGLVALAGIYKAQAFLDIDLATWNQHFDINLKGALLSAQAVLPMMRAQKSGSIVFYASMMARTGSARGAAYAATKGGLLGLARSMALDVAGDGIRVNCVSPAIADTGMPRANMDPKSFAARARDNPMGRIGTPGEMADAAMFLLDPGNSFMTGQDLRVNAGAHLF